MFPPYITIFYRILYHILFLTTRVLIVRGQKNKRYGLFDHTAFITSIKYPRLIFLNFALFSFLAVKEFIHKCCKNTTNQRCYQEHPNICKSIATNKESGAEATSRVNGGSGKGDTKDMYESQGQA